MHDALFKNKCMHTLDEIIIVTIGLGSEFQTFTVCGTTECINVFV